MSSTYLLIGQIRLHAALLACIAQEGGESAQAEVIMVLPGQLLRGQRVQGAHLLGQDLGKENEEETPASRRDSDTRSWA